MNLRDRVRGCVLGGAVGDALGAPVEFQPLDGIRRSYGPAGLDRMVPYGSERVGLITDDTQMALFTMEGLILSRGFDVPAAVFAAHRRWYATQLLPGPPGHDRPQPLHSGGAVIMDGWLAQQPWLYASRAPGNACLAGLRADRMGTFEDPANPDSKGCGAVMRSAPFGLIPAWSPEVAFGVAAECAVQTHGHPTGYLAAGAFAAIVRHLLDGTDLAEAVVRTMETAGSRRDGLETCQALKGAIDAAGEGGPSAERLERLGAGWIAEEALAMSVYCALVHPGDVRSALLLAVNHSGDSDSTGAITGNLLGAWHGERSLPEPWVTALEGRPTMETLADEFVRLVAGSGPMASAPS